MLTKEEAFAKYADVECRFCYYYKYSFTYKGIAPNGSIVTLTYGGNPDDIYKETVSPDSTVKIGDEFYYINIVDKDGNEIFDRFE